MKTRTRSIQQISKNKEEGKKEKQGISANYSREPGSGGRVVAKN